MNAWLNKIIAGSLCVMAFASCEKQDSFTQVKTGTTPTFSATATEFVFTAADADKEAVTYKWTASQDWGYRAVVNYALEVDQKGNGFRNAAEIFNANNGLSRTFTVAALNQAINNLGLAAGRQHELVIRIKAAVDTAADKVYSDSVLLTVTPYYVPKVYPSIYVPGGYQGWSFDDPRLGTLASVNNDKKYEGFLNFPDANTEFKITPMKGWDTNYGDGGGGTLVSNGGNLKAAEAGYYKLTADLNTLTWTLTRTTWSINGSAVGGADKALTFDATTKKWSITTPLQAGSFYFRANNANTISLSDDDNNGVLTAGNAGAINIATAGTYTITMDLSNAGNYIYTLSVQ
ncbi:SusE domain-containing protein [Chitinophaga rhizophila]|uniref:SusE domain-containing protein n=1 Tax=Chitinophaga rhizophila TaxID=2866212 RepID=A0ABS7G5A9_9BACT|nr:SusE domain-containing protein [Chitinophaga rhizophila]MBW8682803.1 SusE domain-containing protein [Chitinophaga rhizophila]